MTALTAIALAFTVGVGIGTALPSPGAVALAACAASFALAVVAALSKRRFASAVLVCALVTGWIRVDAKEPQTQAPLVLEDCPRIIEGRIENGPMRIGDRTRIALALEARSTCLKAAKTPRLSPAGGTVHLTANSAPSPLLARGARVRLVARISKAAAHANIGEKPLEPRDDSFFAFVGDPSSIVLLSRAPVSLDRALDRLRERYAAFWDGALDDRPAALARALALGEANAMAAGDKEAFRRTGTAHLLAISGLHLGLVVLAVFGVLRASLLRLSRLAARTDVGRIAAVAAIAFVVAFTLFVGARPPVVRACVMACSVLAARALGRRAGAVESIALAAAAMLAYDPSQLTSAGFQLSFGAVLGFLVTVRRRREKTVAAAGERPSLPARILRGGARLAKGWLLGSLAATAATTPLVLYHFGYFSPISVPVNALAVPFSTLLVMPALLATTLLSPLLEGIAPLAAAPAGALLELILALVERAAVIPFSSFHPGPAAAVGICGLCLGALIGLAGRPRACLAVCATALVFTVCAIAIERDESEKDAMIIDVLDVGQGESILLTFPDGRRWLVDAGGTAAARIGRDHIVPVLRAMGVSSIDTLILTHPDPDHVEGMADVLEAFGAKEIWDNGQGAAEGADDDYERLLESARRRGVPVRRTSALCGERRVAGVDVEVLHPCDGGGDWDPGLSFNENSLVLRIEHEGAAALLTGDLGVEGEAALLRHGTLRPIDVLKLGHHGSRTSTSERFLARAAPAIAIASCGARNAYGMPHREVVDALRRKSAHLFRTDIDGAVRVVLRDCKVKVRAVRGACCP